MALSFTGGDTDKVSHGSDASLNTMTTATLLMWLYVDNIDDNARLICCKTDAIADGWLINRSGGTGSRLVFLANRATVDDSAESVSNTLQAGQWQFIAVKWDTAGEQNPGMYWGDLDTIVSEVAYQSGPTSGTDAQDDDSAFDFTTGNLDGALNFSFPGDVAWVGVYKEYLTDAQIRAHQFNLSGPIYDNSVIFTHYGLPGDASSAQPDWSGSGNNGAVTGATQAAHVPIPVSPFSIFMPYSIFVAEDERLPDKIKIVRSNQIPIPQLQL